MDHELIPTVRCKTHCDAQKNMGLSLSVYGVTIRDTKKIKIVQQGGLDI